MRCPSEYFFRVLLTFHSTSAGGFLEPPPKYMSYSIFSRRSWSSNTVSSSSTAKDWLHFSCQIQYQRHAPLNQSNQAKYTIGRDLLLRAQGTRRESVLRCL